jgi:hypothetical protein
MEEVEGLFRPPDRGQIPFDYGVEKGTCRIPGVCWRESGEDAGTG